MADEIKVTETIRVTKTSTNYKDSIAPGQISFDMAGNGGGNPGVVNIGTSEENVSFGDLTPNMVWMQNLDPTNYVQWGMSDAGTMKAVGRLNPGETARFVLDSGVTLRMKAHTAACDVLIKGY